MVDADWDSRRAMKHDCAGDGEGTARGRRGRRLRSFLSQERMSVVMALAESSRGHRTARAREEVEDEFVRRAMAPDASTQGCDQYLCVSLLGRSGVTAVRRSAGDAPLMVLQTLRGYDGVEEEDPEDTLALLLVHDVLRFSSLRLVVALGNLVLLYASLVSRSPLS